MSTISSADALYRGAAFVRASATEAPSPFPTLLTSPLRGCLSPSPTKQFSSTSPYEQSPLSGLATPPSLLKVASSLRPCELPPPPLPSAFPSSTHRACERQLHEDFEVSEPSHQVASKRAARLCTDLIFAAVMENTEGHTSNNECDLRLTALAQKAGMEGQMEDLVHAAAAKLELVLASRENEASSAAPCSQSLCHSPTTEVVHQSTDATPVSFMLEQGIWSSRRDLAAPAPPCSPVLCQSPTSEAVQQSSDEMPGSSMLTSSETVSRDFAPPAPSCTAVVCKSPTSEAVQQSNDAMAEPSRLELGLSSSSEKVRRPVPTRPSSVPASVTLRRPSRLRKERQQQTSSSPPIAGAGASATSDLLQALTSATSFAKPAPVRPSSSPSSAVPLLMSQQEDVAAPDLCGSSGICSGSPGAAPWFMRPSCAPSYAMLRTAAPKISEKPCAQTLTCAESCIPSLSVLQKELVAAARSEASLLKQACDNAGHREQIAAAQAASPFLRPSCVPSCSVRRPTSPTSLCLPRSQSLPAESVLPSTPPAPARGRRPRPAALTLHSRPAAPHRHRLALTQATALRIGCPEQPRPLEAKCGAADHGKPQSPIAFGSFPSQREPDGITKLLRQQPDAPIISPSKQSDTSTATPPGSAQFVSPNHSLQTSPDQRGTTPGSMQMLVTTPGPRFTQLLQETWGAIAPAPSRPYSVPSVSPEPKTASAQLETSTPLSQGGSQALSPQALWEDSPESSCTRTPSRIDQPGSQGPEHLPATSIPAIIPDWAPEAPVASANFSAPRIQCIFTPPPSPQTSLRPLSSLSRRPSHSVLSPSVVGSLILNPPIRAAETISLRAFPQPSDSAHFAALRAKAWSSWTPECEPPKRDGGLPKATAQCVHDKHAKIAEARDALDVALLCGAEAMKRGISDESRRHAKEKASDALALALLAEARETGIDVTPARLLKAKAVAQGALDFILTERNLDLDARTLDELKVHAQDAVQVGLLAMERAEDVSEEEPCTWWQSSALEALEQLLCIASQVLQGRLTGKSLVDARKSARDAVARAIACEAQCSRMDVTQEDLECAMERACLALDLVMLAEPEMRTSEEQLLVKQRALNSLHLALLGVR